MEETFMALNKINNHFTYGVLLVYEELTNFVCIQQINMYLLNVPQGFKVKKKNINKILQK